MAFLLIKQLLARDNRRSAIAAALVYFCFINIILLWGVSVTGGNQECVELLVAAGANIELEDVKGQTPLFVATSQRKPSIMKV